MQRHAGFYICILDLNEENNIKMSCSICLEDLKHNLIITPCKHQFHRPCLEKWIKNSCPLCRRKIHDRFYQLEMEERECEEYVCTLGYPDNILTLLYAKYNYTQLLPLLHNKNKFRKVLQQLG